MKNYITLLFLTMTASQLEGQHFKVEAVSAAQARRVDATLSINNSNKYFKIRYISDSSDLGLVAYPIKINSEARADTLQLIEDLLSLEGDQRLCFIPVRNYNPTISQIYMGNLKCYSIQVEALFIINQLYFERPFEYSAYPILVQNGLVESVGGPVVKEAFKYYRNWLNALKLTGLSKSKREFVKPLDGSGIKWYP